MQRSLNDFFAKNRNETVKRKHDSNSDDDSADPNNNVIKMNQCQLQQKNLNGQKSLSIRI